MSVSVDLNSTERVMYQGNNHIKCIYGPNNTLLWSEEPYFTYKASGSGNIQLRIDNSGTATQATPAVIYYWKNVEPNAARDNYTGTLTAATSDVGTNKVTYVAGDVIKMWRAEQTAFGYGLNNTNYLIGGSNCIVYGNIASLVNYVSVMPEFCFERLFYYTGITDFSGLIIPWDTISRYGMNNFLYGGSQITSESQLPFFPATTVNNYGYNRLIRGLVNLTSIDMTKHFCYKYAGKEALSQMFIDTRLESIKVKWDVEPIDSTSTRIFSQLIMRNSVENITNLDPNPTSTKYDNWITAKADVGTFTKAAGVTWTIGTSGIPSGWTVQNNS